MPSVDDLWADLPRRARDAERARGTRRYVARWRTSTGASRKKRFHSEAEALRWAMDHEGEGPKLDPDAADISPASLAAWFANPETVRLATAKVESLRDAGQLTVAHGVEFHLYKKRGLKERGLENAALHARHLVRDLGNRILTDLTGDEVEDWTLEVISEGVAPSSAQKRLIALRSVFRYCGVFDPTGEVVVSQTRTPIASLTMAELARLATAMRYRATIVNPSTVERPNANTLEALTLVLGLLGPRISEALSIKVEDLHIERAELYIPGTKTKQSPRYNPVPPALMEKLVPLAAGRKPKEFLFMPATGKKPFTRSKIGHYVREASLRVLGRQIRVHDLRHTAASLAISESNVFVAADLLGHKNASITAAIYGHTTPDEVRKAVTRTATMVTAAQKPKLGWEGPPRDTSENF